MGGLGWTPAGFWSATPAELFMAIAGHNRVNRRGPEPMTGEGLQALDAAHPDCGSIRDRLKSSTFEPVST